MWSGSITLTKRWSGLPYDPPIQWAEPAGKLPVVRESLGHRLALRCALRSCPNERFNAIDADNPPNSGLGRVARVGTSRLIVPRAGGDTS